MFGGGRVAPRVSRYPVMNPSLSVVALSGFPVAGFVWRWPSGPWMLTVVCRATFALKPGTACVAEVQENPIQGDRGYPDGSSAGLYAPTDLVPVKPRVDVMVVSRAVASPASLGNPYLARLVVGGIDKRIEIDPRRPASDASLTRFGPIAAQAAPRRALMGATLDPRTADEWRGRVVPLDLDPAFFNAAPSDQQLHAVRDDERIVLENLHPSMPGLVTHLPGLRPLAVLERRGRVPERLLMRADTLWIDSGLGTCAVTWRGQVPIGRQPSLRVLVAMDQAPSAADQHNASDHAPSRESSPAPQGPSSGLAETADAPSRRGPKKPTFPFRMSDAPPPPRDFVPQGGLPFHPVNEAPRETPPPPVVPPRKALSFPEAPAREPVAPSWAVPRELPSPPLAMPPAPPPPPLAVIPVAPPLVMAPQSLPAFGNPPLALPSLGFVPPPTGDPKSPWARGLAGFSHPMQPQASFAAAPAVVPVQLPTTASRDEAKESLQLVWFNRARTKTLSTDPRFDALLTTLDVQGSDADLDREEDAADVANDEERNQVFEIMARGPLATEDDLASMLAASTRPDGRLFQPVVLVAGTMVFPFDEIATLKATVSAATPHAGENLAVKEALDTARSFLALTDLPRSGGVAMALSTRIHEAMEQARLVPTGTLRDQVKKALLGTRSLQQREVLGEPHDRALLQLTATGSPESDPPMPRGQQRSRRPEGRSVVPLPVYLAKGLSSQLPPSDRLHVRILAYLHPALDASETHALALHPLALVTVTKALALQ